MPDRPDLTASDVDLPARLARLEERVAWLEQRLVGSDSPVVAGPPPALVSPFPAAHQTTEDELEYEIGQNWFARAGIFVLTIGVALVLLLPFSSVPAIVPPLIGFCAASLLFLLSRAWRRSFEVLATHLFGAAMSLMFFGALRLCLPEQHHVVALHSPAAQAILVASVAANIAFAVRRRSPWLLALAVTSGAVTAIVVGTAWFLLGMIVATTAIATLVARTYNWRSLLASLPLLAYATYFIWAIGNPLRGNAIQFETGSPAAPLFVLLMIGFFAAGSIWRRDRANEDAATNTAALVNSTLGYGVFVVHAAASFPRDFIALDLAASVLLLAVAMCFWHVERSRVSTFFYAMVGYVAISIAILRASAIPNVFVWLSLQSLLVVTTAIWFRSRFIVTANFAIFVLIIFGYVFLSEKETGISIGFGLVALLSARILNWQKHRLELRTEFMRNAYLATAFIVFPYALYHLVPSGYVGLAWIGLSGVYYGLNLIVRNQKYRWMGHATLLVTTFYLVVVGTRHFDPLYRIMSFLALGTALLVVSISFTRGRRNRSPDSSAPSAG